MTSAKINLLLNSSLSSVSDFFFVIMLIKTILYTVFLSAHDWSALYIYDMTRENRKRIVLHISEYKLYIKKCCNKYSAYLGIGYKVICDNNVKKWTHWFRSTLVFFLRNSQWVHQCGETRTLPSSVRFTCKHSKLSQDSLLYHEQTGQRHISFKIISQGNKSEVEDKLQSSFYLKFLLPYL